MSIKITMVRWIKKSNILQILYNRDADLRKWYMCFSLILLIGLAPRSLMAQTGLTFLKLGVGARSAGLGNAYTAVTSDATALYWNPARMTTVVGTDLSMIHTQWFQGVSHEFVGAVMSNGTSAVGLGFMLMVVDGIERRTDIPTATALGTFSAYDVMVSGSYARQVSEAVSFGVTFKGINEKILFDSASGFAFDFGAQYQTPYDGLSVGGSLRNIGPKFSFIREKFNLPSELRLGVGYIPGMAIFQRQVLLSADLSKYRDESLRMNFGGEYTYQGKFSAAVGYQARQDEVGFSTGLGVRWQKYRLDYAFVPFGANLGNTHRFALGLRFQ